MAINPGNPTGNVLSEASMREVLTFAAQVMREYAELEFSCCVVLEFVCCL